MVSGSESCVPFIRAFRNYSERFSRYIEEDIKLQILQVFVACNFPMLLVRSQEGP